MNFSVAREVLLRPLSIMVGVVPRRHTLPILSHLCLTASEEGLTLTGLDLEVELTWQLDLVKLVTPGSITVPAKKLADICRSLSEGSVLDLVLEDQRVVVRSGRSRFVLASLPAADFPNIELSPVKYEVTLPQQQLLSLIQRTDFAMAKQDVRFYLNGMFFELTANRLRTIATDGHRLALANLDLSTSATEKSGMIVPAKAITDLAKLLDSVDDPVTLVFGEQHFQANLGKASFVSKHIDGRYPEYEQVIPRNLDKLLTCDKLELRQMLSRISILANEKLLGIHLHLSTNSLTLKARNSEQEEAEETMQVDYQGEPLEIGFNVSYLIEVMDNIGDEVNEVQMSFYDPASSALIQAKSSQDACYVVMPMRI